MKMKLKEWSDHGYYFNLDWLLRSVNTVLTGEAKFSFLHDRSAEEVREGLTRALKAIDISLNLIGVPDRSARRSATSFCSGSPRPACGAGSPVPPSHSSTRTLPRSRAPMAA